MAKKEKIFPLDTIGGRLQAKMIEKGFSKIDLYNAIYPASTALPEDSKKKTVYNWFSGKVALSIDDVKTLCRLLDCSSDYLLGLDECSNKSIQYIHDVTGLSEQAIHTLTIEKCFPDIITLLNMLLTQERLFKLYTIMLKTKQYPRNGNVFMSSEELEDAKTFNFSKGLSELFADLLMEKEVYNTFSKRAELLYWYDTKSILEEQFSDEIEVYNGVRDWFYTIQQEIDNHIAAVEGKDYWTLHNVPNERNYVMAFGNPDITVSTDGVIRSSRTMKRRTHRKNDSRKPDTYSDTHRINKQGKT